MDVAADTVAERWQRGQALTVCSIQQLSSLLIIVAEIFSLFPKQLCISSCRTAAVWLWPTSLQPNLGIFYCKTIYPGVLPFMETSMCVSVLEISTIENPGHWQRGRNSWSLWETDENRVKFVELEVPWMQPPWFALLIAVSNWFVSRTDPQSTRLPRVDFDFSYAWMGVGALVTCQSLSFLISMEHSHRQQEHIVVTIKD